MIPVDLNGAEVRIAVVAREKALTARLRYLRRGGAKRLRVFSDKPGEVLQKRLEGKIFDRLPTGEDLKGVQVLFIAGLKPEETLELVQLAKRRRILVNCEGPHENSGIHLPSVVRRGALTISVSTDGLSPVLGNRIRRVIGKSFGKEWAQRVKELSKAREVWLANGAKPGELTKMINSMIDEKNWLP